MSVREWPTYLLWNISQPLRNAISEEAQRENLSVAETIRKVLCDYYKLECQPVTIARGGQVGYDETKDLRSNTFYLRVQPEVFEAIKEDALRRADTMKACILDALVNHYERTPAT